MNALRGIKRSVVMGIAKRAYAKANGCYGSGKNFRREWEYYKWQASLRTEKR